MKKLLVVFILIVLGSSICFGALKKPTQTRGAFFGTPF